MMKNWKPGSVAIHMGQSACLVLERGDRSKEVRKVRKVRKSGSREVRKSGSQEVRKTGSPKDRKSERQEVRKVRKVRKSGSPKDRKSGKLGKTRSPESWKSQKVLLFTTSKGFVTPRSQLPSFPPSKYSFFPD